ncbi:adenylate/guanylate cyclase domain-containing protein [Saccharothrix syringae]|uniref:Adenylate/guanylate cyclase domain-containing protein n=1 Tax=Saccharothrix syringae TaxID=103733 RepID=A0A5Q0GUM4_SACSY|nr:adenylate/guanylate cyclase domain-containing protein [Saccharothrix syringae]QFZ17204.1 adenylate/guanylate cyclase domain-containing protein [Saccharothrix syringae]
MAERFEAGRTYENVYLLVVDAVGYSRAVRDHPRDRVSDAFNLLRTTTESSIADLAAEHGCARAELWSWRGDGGIFAIHDDNESAALATALNAGRALVTDRLHQVREHFARIAVRCSLHVRVALHKGTIRYSGDSGTIHTPEINFVSHLEEAVPGDCLAISEDVHRIGGDLVLGFEAVGEFEDRQVHVLAPPGVPAKRLWLAHRGFTDSLTVHAYRERPSQADKARLVDTAAHEVVDLSTALNTCAGYLTTSERPASFRNAVLSFLRRGGTYRCVVLAPDSPAVAALAQQRDEDLPGRIRRSVERLGEFKARHPGATDRFEVHQVPDYAGFAALATDLDDEHGLLMYSPYLGVPREPGPVLERGDMPHYLVDRSAGQVFETLHRVVRSFADAGGARRVL